MRMTGFICQDVYLSKLAKLSDQEVGRLMRALMQYHASGDAPELTGRESVAFDFIKDDIDRAEAAYQAKCDKNRQNRTTTNDDERPRPSTDDNERPQNINKKEKEIENKDKDENKTREARARKVTSESFDRFWAAYPRHDAKQPAVKAFEKIKPNDSLMDTILAAIEKNKASPQWTRDSGQYIPMAATWLNQRRWEDEPQKAAPQTTGAVKTVSAQMYQQREYEDDNTYTIPDWMKKRLAEADKEATA